MREVLAVAGRFRRFYTKLFQPLAEEYGLSQLEIDILLFLHNNPECDTARDITNLRGFAKSNVSKAVEALSRRGWLDVRTDPSDRKLRRLRIKPAALDGLEALCTCQESFYTVLLKGFAPEEREALHRVLERLDSNIQKAMEDLEGGESHAV